MRIQNRTQSTLLSQASETRSPVVSQLICQSGHDKSRGRQPSRLSADAILRRQLRRRLKGQQIDLRSSIMPSWTTYILSNHMAMQEARSDFTLILGVRGNCTGRRTQNGGSTSTTSLGIDNMRSIHRTQRWLKSFKGCSNATG